MTGDNNKLTVEELRMITAGELFKTDSKELGVYEGGQLHQKLAFQLLNTMRENERLQEALSKKTSNDWCRLCCCKSCIDHRSNPISLMD